MSIKFVAALAGLALVLPIASCRSFDSHNLEPAAGLAGIASTTLRSDTADHLESAIFPMEVEADCGGGAITDPPLADVACTGELPEHLAWFLRNMPDTHPFLTAPEREQAAQSRQSFKAVKGLGLRPDVVAVINHYSLFWIRSFEGPDPDITVYMVYGPDCDASAALARDANRRCRPSSTYSREFALYRVRKGQRPENVTRALAPSLPRLSEQERSRYGVYVLPEGEANDADIKLDVSRLVHVPVLRWVLRPVQEGEYQPPDMPATDPRAFTDQDWGTGSVAHFGFLVWNGRRMELHETVSSSLWPCRSPNPKVCGQGYDSRIDRYLD